MQIEIDKYTFIILLSSEGDSQPESQSLKVFIRVRIFFFLCLRNLPSSSLEICVQGHSLQLHKLCPEQLKECRGCCGVSFVCFRLLSDEAFS